MSGSFFKASLFNNPRYGQTLILFAVLALLISGCAGAPRQVIFNQVTYTNPRSEGLATVYQAADGQTLRVEPLDEGGARVIIADQVYRVGGTGSDVLVTFPDGRELSRTYRGSESYSGSALGVETTFEDWDRVDELRAVVFPKDLDSPPDFPRIIFGVLLACFGALQIANPNLAFQIAEGWRFNNVEPSDLYLTLLRVSGVILVGVGLVLTFG